MSPWVQIKHIANFIVTKISLPHCSILAMLSTLSLPNCWLYQLMLGSFIYLIFFKILLMPR